MNGSVSESEIHTLIVPVTKARQNCAIVWCPKTLKAAVIDPGGEIPRLVDTLAQHGLTLDRIWVTHGHMDHSGGADALRRTTGAPIEGPHRDDAETIGLTEEFGRTYGFPEARSYIPDRWLEDGERLRLGETEFEVYHCPGHSPGHVVYFHRQARQAHVGDILFRGSIGYTEHVFGDQELLIHSITTKLWPLGSDVSFVPGHGPKSTFGQERLLNPFVADVLLP